MLPASAKHKTIKAIRNAATMYATGLAAPRSEATVAGKTKIPEPITPFTAIAIKPNKPTALRNLGVLGLVEDVGFNGLSERRSGVY